MTRASSTAISSRRISCFCPDGTIKVTDFGIARFSRQDLTRHHRTDKAIGSVHYISPEQARGELTDEKADIYSVGVMLYEMLTGQRAL